MLKDERKDWKTCVNICKKEITKKKLSKKELIDLVYKRFAEKDNNKNKLNGLLGNIG